MAQVIFNPETGVEIPDTKTIRDDLAKAIQNALIVDSENEPVNVDPTSPLGQVIDLIVAEIEAKNAEIAFLSNQFNPLNATGIFLDGLAGLYGIKRKTSEPTIVECTCRGLKNTVIPYGAIVQDTQGNRLRHSTASGAVIGNDGTVLARFATVEHGPIEILSHTVNSIVTVIPGWDSIDNESSGITGRDIEPDGELLNRMRESYAINANGTVANVQACLADLDGVLDCTVLENYTNKSQVQYGITLEPHSIAVCIVGGEDEKIAEVIFNRKSAGCGTNGNTDVTFVDKEHFNAVYVYKIVRPEIKDLKVKVTFFEQINLDIQNSVKNAIVQDFLGELSNPRVNIASSLYASRFYRCVQTVTDAPIESIEIGFKNESLGSFVEIPADVSPTLTVDDILIENES